MMNGAADLGRYKDNSDATVRGEDGGVDLRTRVALTVLVDMVRRFASSREFDAEDPPLHTLSRLLWAAVGGSAWTAPGAPGASGDGEVEIYVALASGTYRFDRCHMELESLSTRDIRPLIATLDKVSTVPINLIYARKPATQSPVREKDAVVLAAIRTASLFENVWRFCAGNGLATLARGWLDRPTLAAALDLQSHRGLLLAQSVGYPAPQPRTQE